MEDCGRGSTWRRRALSRTTMRQLFVLSASSTPGGASLQPPRAVMLDAALADAGRDAGAAGAVDDDPCSPTEVSLATIPAMAVDAVARVGRGYEDLLAMWVRTGTSFSVLVCFNFNTQHDHLSLVCFSCNPHAAATTTYAKATVN